MTVISERVVQRFWAKVDRSGGPDACWPWVGTRILCRGGYGVLRLEFRRGSRVQGAHRFAWELHNGPIPAGMCICHHCDNPPCVNPSHLFLGTRADNIADMVAKGRSHHNQGRVGENHPRAKLTQRQVEEIRLRYAAGGVTQRQLAREYGVTQTPVWQVIAGRTWPDPNYTPMRVGSGHTP